tara:strand:+ start:1884 stop:2714 length:831 start_codon:yes stop_codon:yes gene_type:complete
MTSDNTLINDHGEKSTVLACQTVPNSDCLVELSDPKDILVVKPQIVRAQVASIEKLADRVLEITLRTKKPLRFAAGQHFELSLSTNFVRMYSAASLPSDLELKFQVQLHPGGRASKYFIETLKIGETVRLRGPMGTAYLREHCTAPTLFVSSGTGLGAMLALLRSFAKAGKSNAVHAYAGFTMSEDAYGADALDKAIADIMSARNYQRVIGGGPMARRDRRGLLTEALAANLGDLRMWRAYVFGSPHATEATARLLRQKGITPERLHVESFQFAAI